MCVCVCVCVCVRARAQVCGRERKSHVVCVRPTDPVSSAPKSGKTSGGKRKSTVAAPAPAPATKKSRGGRAASESKGPEELGGLDGVVICITGTCASMKRQAMVELIEQAGGTVSKSVTAKVRHAVQGMASGLARPHSDLAITDHTPAVGSGW